MTSNLSGGSCYFKPIWKVVITSYLSRGSCYFKPHRMGILILTKLVLNNHSNRTRGRSEGGVGEDKGLSRADLILIGELSAFLYLFYHLTNCFSAL